MRVQEINFHSQQMFFDVQSFHDDEELKEKIFSCIEAQKEIGQKDFDTKFKPNPKAAYSVSDEALDNILKNQEAISDIRMHEHITNCLVFHTTNLEGSLIDKNVIDLRQKADTKMIEKIKELFKSESNLTVQMSGHFWYPPESFMGWHTNLRKPGWRMYVNYAEEEGKSFFRYRDPDSQKIITSWDKQWNFRLFQITPQKPFWHAVYSQTNRYSLGYMITQEE